MALTQVQDQMFSGSTNTTTAIQSNGTTAITIDATQNVGIGVTPSAWASSVPRAIQVGSATGIASNSDGTTQLINNAFYNSGASWKYIISGFAARIAMNVVDGTMGFFTAASGTAGNTVSFVQAMTLAGNRLSIGTSSAIINESSLGVTSAGNTCTFQTTAVGSQPILCWNAYSGGGTVNQIQFFTGSSYTTSGTITSNGTTTNYGTSSDYRLKNNITPLNVGLETISKLNPVSFNWNLDNRKDTGFIAHELQAILPNCVTGEKDAVNKDGSPIYQQMDSSGVIPFLVKAIQELNAKVDAQAAEIAALKAK